MRASIIDWSPYAGRVIGSETVDESPAGYRVVACLNVWNDRAALERTVPTWIDHVDAVIAVDGSYPATGAPPLSTDGTREFLQSIDKVRLVDRGHCSQFDKRNAYFELGEPGDMMFVVDADERVYRGDALRQIPRLDVGWVRIESSMYRRSYGQPRLFAWTPGLQYRGRHHWTYLGDRLLTTHQYGGQGFEHRIVDLTLQNRRGLGHSAERTAAKRSHARAQLLVEAPASSMPSAALSDSKLGAREALRIVTAALRDDGLAPSRLHSAINRTTPHSSLFFKGTDGPFGVGSQYSTGNDADLLAQAMADSDVVHLHVTFQGLSVRSSSERMLVMHHHGTMLRDNFKKLNPEAARRRALVLLSNLDLLDYAPTGEYLENPVPVGRYARLHRERHAPGLFQTRPFRVAHSPSKPYRKGTDDFLVSINRLQAKGVPIEGIVITGVSHADALTAKAECDATFDSFALGMQCSGIEGAAMGMPVIAGDAKVADRVRARYGYLPWTFAGDVDELEAVLFRLVSDEEFRQAEAGRVAAHVMAHHDEAAVALRYLDLLDVKFGWRSRAK